MNTAVEDFWWVEDDLYLKLNNGETVCMQDAYLADIYFDGLDIEINENVTMVG